MAVHSQGEGPLFVHEDSSPLTQSQFVQATKRVLQLANIDATRYSGHSLKIGAATAAAAAAAAAGVPAYFIKMLEQWQSKAYHSYIHTLRESLASVSQLFS